MKACPTTLLWFTLNWAVLLLHPVAGESYYSVIAPGVIKSNRNYTVVITLHEAQESAAIRVAIEGPHYQESRLVFVKPYEAVKIAFLPHKLAVGDYKLIAEGVSGVLFRNESTIWCHSGTGPNIYIQTDRAIYKPGGLIQYRVIILNEHLRPLRIHEPIRVEILDGKKNRVKQIKDISLVKGVYHGQLRLSEYPILGYWQIKVSISGKYDYTSSTYVNVQKYLLPKFSVYIETEQNFLSQEDSVVKAVVYGKYTFDKYVEGNLTAKLISSSTGMVIQQQELNLKDKVELIFSLGSVENVKALHYSFTLQVEMVERHTGLKEKAVSVIRIREQSYNIYVDRDSVTLLNDKPHSLTVKVQHWNNSAVTDASTPVVMQQGSKKFESFLNGSGEALFEFTADDSGDYMFSFNRSTYTMPSYFIDRKANRTDAHCRLNLKGNRPRLGAPVLVEVSSSEYIPYLIYTIIGHATIIRMEHITLPRYQKNYTIEITPSIEMIPSAFLYVHYIQDGILHYEELRLNFPREFENQISVVAPHQVRPGQEVTLHVMAQPKSYVCLLAVDLSVYLIDPSYDLDKAYIMQHLQEDVSDIPTRSIVYPGRLSGLITFTNAHYEFVPAPLFATASSKSVEGPKRIRSDFPETWIFQCIETSNDVTELTLNIPDTITTWRLTAFSINEVTGLGLVDGPMDIVATKPFFLRLNLPYSVKLGEILAIPIITHNYHNQSLDTEITMHNQGGHFYFMDSIIFDPTRGSEDLERSKHVQLPANGFGRVSFLINAKKAGDFNLNITATNSLSSDAIAEKLKVEPEGLLQQHTKGMYIDLFSGETTMERFTLDTPLDSLYDAEFITLSAASDSLVPALHNLNHLVMLPTGCGEQNMANFAPNILMLQYLKATGKYYLEKELANKAKGFIESGFQQQLSYRHGNGGYSVFGPQSGEEPSTWLTAYVIRFFVKASKYVAIEAQIISSGLDYLAQAQKDDGSFAYTGYLLHPAQKNRFGFTAFVLLTFLEDRVLAMKYNGVIDKGLQFLTSNLEHVQDIYALSIMAVALSRARKAEAKIVLDKLKLQSRQSQHLVWWSENDRNAQKDVEITAYVLMARLHNGEEPGDDPRILKWLTEQRNERGGFTSTHDTVVGLEALVKFSEKYNNVESKNLNIQYSAKAADGSILKSGEFRVNINTEQTWRKEELPKSTRLVDIQASGFGHSLLQLTYHYRVVPKQTSEHFQIKPVTKMMNSIQMRLEICFGYKPPHGPASTDDAYSNMIIMEVNLPSGFSTTDAHRSELLKNYSIIRRLEATNANGGIIMYFEKLSANVSYCLTIVADKLHDVLARKPSTIVVYDYYNRSQYDTALYSYSRSQPVGGDPMEIR